ncbi:MAG TPA: TadE family type IV pilus minor pilin [Actinomycetaceae bacterium]|nr:TadE family type IV pilus minor pilin [Actinomycetaceae bacterium]
MTNRLRSRGEGGFATVEFALTLPAVVLVLGLCLAVLAAAGTQLRAGDAARAAVREVAIGAPAGRVAAVVEQLAGPAAQVTVANRGEFIVATVTVPLPALGEWGDFDAVAEAVAIPEQ